MTPPPHPKNGRTKPGTYVLLKGQKYLPEKNKNSFHSALDRGFVQIWEIMQIIQNFFPNYDYVSMTPCPPVSKRKHLADPLLPPLCLRNTWMFPKVYLRSKTQNYDLFGHD